MVGEKIKFENKEVRELINNLKRIQKNFYIKFGVKDIYSNSKFFEILIADVFNHELIPGHSGSRDAKDKFGEYEYKHYKETSCNHTWTFNDFSDTTIKKLCGVKAVVFAHIDDTKKIPVFNWCYIVPGGIISNYLKKKTVNIKNKRKMINISRKQIEKEMRIKKTLIKIKPKGKYSEFFYEIFNIAMKIEDITNTKNILTSNKIWEVLVGIKLNHKVLSEQKKFDAIDSEGKNYEYKVSKTYSFNFEDISDNVLKKFINVEKIILAIIDKEKMEIVHLYYADPGLVVKKLIEKLKAKKERYLSKGKEIRRLQVSLSKGDLKEVAVKKIL